MKVAVVGLGPIGVEVARAVAGGSRPGLVLGAVVDVAPALAGKPLAGVAGAELTVDATLEAGLARGIEAVALCTGSRVAAIAPDVMRAIAAGAHVVSTCEELALPPDSPESAAIDAAARRASVTVAGTGVTPEFVMDRLPLQLAAMCVRVEGITVERVVDAALRRVPLQKKVGSGLGVTEFRAGIDSGILGHVGLRASAGLIARGLGTQLVRSDETVDPVVDEAGRVLGVRQRLTAETADGRPIELRLQMSMRAETPHDRVIIAGDPPLDVTIERGTHGDRATVAAVVDALWRLPRSPRGLVTVAEIY